MALRTMPASQINISIMNHLYICTARNALFFISRTPEPLEFSFCICIKKALSWQDMVPALTYLRQHFQKWLFSFLPQQIWYKYTSVQMRSIQSSLFSVSSPDSAHQEMPGIHCTVADSMAIIDGVECDFYCYIRNTFTKYENCVIIDVLTARPHD